MPIYTPKRNLIKPDEDDFYDIDDFNSNADKLDDAVPDSRKINGKSLVDDVTITTDDVGAAPLSHNHDAANITSGTLSVARGGTGQPTLQATRNAMGLGNTTGVLPVANGGTGASGGAAALANLGAYTKTEVNNALSGKADVGRPTQTSLTTIMTAGHSGGGNFSRDLFFNVSAVGTIRKATALTNNTIVANFPVGYRPANDVILVVPTQGPPPTYTQNGGYANLILLPSGALYVDFITNANTFSIPINLSYIALS